VSATLDGGFADPVFDAQAVFRALMEAVARPGSIHRLGAVAAPPAPLGPAAGAILLAVSDADTPVYLDPSFAAAVDWLRFQTGAPVIGEPGRAVLAVLAGLDAHPLDAFPLGTAEYPDRSATLIVQLASLRDGTPLILTGPGIADRSAIAPHPVPAGFVAAWDANRARFPRGVDLILAAGEEMAGLPRTTRVAAA
jgi:alpha-D-ribose 1-methylphosphonate 5-triphosphate synthase subunit PhnH